jgi:hypothetical protein
MRKLISVVAGLFGCWLCLGGLMSVAMTEPGSFLPASWSNLLLGAAILLGSVLLWRRGSRHGTGQQAREADERRS